MLLLLPLVLSLTGGLPLFPQLKIFQPIVSAIAVLVMDALMSEKRPPQVLRHDPAMFERGAGSVLHCPKHGKIAVIYGHSADDEVSAVVRPSGRLAALAQSFANAGSSVASGARPTAPAKVGSLHHDAQRRESVPFFAPASRAGYRRRHTVDPIHTPHFGSAYVNRGVTRRQLIAARHLVAGNLARSALPRERAALNVPFQPIDSVPANSAAIWTRYRSAQGSLLSARHQSDGGKINCLMFDHKPFSITAAIHGVA